MNQHKSLLLPLLLLMVSVIVSACFLNRAPNALPEKDQAAAPASPSEPPKPTMKVLKVSGAGAGQTNVFVAKVEWNGKDPADWVVKRWMMMRDKTGQTQSMLVIEEQKFSIAPGEPRIVQIKAIPVDPKKEPPRNLIVDYAGMPQYELVEQCDHPTVKALLGALDKINTAMTEMMPLVRFVKDSIQYSPKDRAKIEPYLEIVVWDLSGDKPQPYIEPTVIEAAFVTAFAGGMTVKDYSSYLQKKNAGLPSTSALKEAEKLQTRVNKLLEFASLDVRMRK